MTKRHPGGIEPLQKGLRDRISPFCTLSQNGYGGGRAKSRDGQQGWWQLVMVVVGGGWWLVVVFVGGPWALSSARARGRAIQPPSLGRAGARHQAWPGRAHHITANNITEGHMISHSLT